MADYERKFDKNKIHSVELNLLDGQVDLILRALELYGYNLEYMLNSNDATDEQKQEKISMLQYTYEQVLASQAEQVDTIANNIDNLNSLGKLLSNNFVQTPQKNNLKAIQYFFHVYKEISREQGNRLFFEMHKSIKKKFKILK